MKKSILSLSILFCYSFFVQAQDLAWENTYPYQETLSQGFDVEQTNDGGYIFVGSIDFPTGAIRHYIRLIKTDALGNEEWSHIYYEGDVLQQEGYSVEQCLDGGYIIAGSKTTASNYIDLCLLKTDSQGNIEWEKLYGGAFLDQGFNVKQTTDGGFITIGFTISSTENFRRLFVIKTDIEGEIIWEKIYATEMNQFEGYDIIQTSDENYVGIGSDGLGIFLFKLDNQGEFIWTKLHYLSKYDVGYSLAETSAGDLIIGGMDSGFAGTDGLMLKTNSVGEMEWQQVGIGGLFQSFTSLQPTTDGGYIGTGSSWAFDYSLATNGFLIKFDDQGIQEWAYPLIGETYKSGASIKQTSDNGFIMGGTKDGSMHLLKLNGMPVANHDLDKNTDKLLVNVYPNPSTDLINFDIEGEAKFFSFLLLNEEGKIIQQIKSLSNTFTINLKNLSEGIYFYQIKSEKENMTRGSFLKMK